VIMKNKEFMKKMRPWEIGALIVAFSLVAFVALPSYLDSLSDLRGKDCATKLTLVANCLQFLAEKNGTQPGEKICETFDLNEILALAQGVTYQVGETNRWLYYKVGANPDCLDGGAHEISLILGEDGKVQIPTCSLMDSEKGEDFRAKGLHVCDIANVTSEIGID
jgi:hypothetical protein